MKANSTAVWNAFPELKMVSNKEWAEKACAIWEYFWEKSAWDNLEDAAFSILGKIPVTLVMHTQCVVKGAIRLADTLEEVQHEKIDRDVLIIGAILHDASKIVEYCPGEDGVTRITREGEFHQHSFMAAAKAWEMGLPDEIVNIILCHSNLTSAKLVTIEGLLVKCADSASGHAALGAYDGYSGH